jgi:hypothetical protein
MKHYVRQTSCTGAGGGGGVLLVWLSVGCGVGGGVVKQFIGAAGDTAS